MPWGQVNLKRDSLNHIEARIGDKLIADPMLFLSAFSSNDDPEQGRAATAALDAAERIVVSST